MRRTRICEGVTYLEPDSMRSFKACAGLLLCDGGKAALVDANMGPAETLPLLEETHPDLAILSHYHIDHSAWASTAAEHTGAEIWAPEDEVGILADPTLLHTADARAHGIGGEWEAFMADTVGYAPVPSARGYTWGSPFRIGGLRLETLEAGGHSPGHTALYLPEMQILFCGDAGIDRFGPWYGWSNCDLVALVASLLRMRGLPQKLLLTSHGGMVSGDFQANWTQAIAKVLGREVRLRLDLEAGRDREEIVAAGIFFANKDKAPQPMRRFLYMWDHIMYDHHLKVLEKGGLTTFFPELSALAVEALGDLAATAGRPEAGGHDKPAVQRSGTPQSTPSN
jgi:glyoxylase-like metal-dependent hydrolase (beta-lactamase superfamily II)